MRSGNLGVYEGIHLQCLSLRTLVLIAQNEQDARDSQYWQVSQDSVPRLYQQEKIEGKRAPGRRRISHISNNNLVWQELFRIVMNNIRIAMIIAHVQNGQAR